MNVRIAARGRRQHIVIRRCVRHLSVNVDRPGPSVQSDLRDERSTVKRRIHNTVDKGRIPAVENLVRCNIGRRLRPIVVLHRDHEDRIDWSRARFATTDRQDKHRGDGARPHK